MKFKGVVFDLDHTLYDETLYFIEVFTAFCNTVKCGEKVGMMTQAYAELRCQSRDILADVLHKSGFAPDLKGLFFEALTSVNADITPYGDAIVLMNALKERKLKLGLLTNGVVAVQRNKVRSLALAPYFDAILYARQFGRDREKPHKGVFQEIARILNISAKELVFVGDNPGIDFKGAKEINGFTVRIKKGVYRDMPGNVDIDVEIADIKDLEALL